MRRTSFGMKRGTVELGVILSVVAGLAVALAPSKALPPKPLTEAEIRAQQMMDSATATGSKMARLAPAAAGAFVSATTGDPFEAVRRMTPFEIEQLNERLAANPGNPELTLERSRLHAVAGNYEAALTDLDWAAGVSGDSAEHRLRRAKILMRLGRYEEALVDNRAAFQIDSVYDDPEQLAEIYIGLGRYQEALTVLDDRKAPVDATLSPTVEWLYAAAYRGLGNEVEARDHFARARQLEPGYCRHWQTESDPGRHEGSHYRLAFFEFY